MQYDFISNIESYNKAAIESAKRLGEINMRTLEKLAQRHMEATSDCLEGGMKHLKAIGGSKDIQSAVKEQARLSAEWNEKLVEHAKKTAEVFGEVKAELTEWAEDGMKAVGGSFANANESSAKGSTKSA